MSVVCSISSVTREVKSITNHPILQALYGPPLLDLALEAVRRKLPAALIKTVNEPSDLRRGWASRQGIVMNIAHGLRADTPLHELSHIAVAVALHAGGELARRYKAVRQELYGSPAHQQIAERYRVGGDYRLSDQLDETAMELMGRIGVQKLRRNEGGPLQRLVSVLEDALAFLTGQRRLGDGYTISQPLYKLLSTLSDDLLSADNLDVEPEHLDHLLTVARDQRTELPVHTGELLSRLSGRREGMSEDALRSWADSFYKQSVNESSVLVPSLSGSNTKVTLNFPSADPLERRDLLMAYLRTVKDSEDAHALDSMLYILNLPHEDRLKVLNGNKEGLPPNQGPDSPPASVLLSMGTQLLDAFPDLQQGDQILRYSADNKDLPAGVYQAHHDTGNQVIHLMPRIDSKGRKITVARIVSVVGGHQASLTEHVDDKPLLSGLFGSSWGDMIKKWAAGQTGGLNLTASLKNRQLLSSAALAMHLSEQGYQVDGVVVAKLSREISDTQLNDVRLVPITEYLDAWKGLVRIPRVKELLNPELRRLLENKALYKTNRYERDYARLLRQFVSGQKKSEVKTALGEYEAAATDGNIRQLIEAVEARVQALSDHYGENKTGLYGNREFVLLGQTLRQISGIRELSNRYKDLGQLEHLVRAFNAGDHPVLQWFYEQWHQAREAVTESYLKYQDKRKEMTRLLMDDFHKEEGVYNPLYHDEGKYYDALLEKTQHEISLPDGTTKTVEFNEYRFIMPGTKAFADLRPAQQQYIEWALGHIKQEVTARYQKENPRKTADEVQEWYESTWGQGYLPIVEGSAKRALSAGDWDGQGREHFGEMLDANYLYDRQDNTNRDTLSNRFAYQGGKGPHGSPSRMKLLGYVAVPLVDQATGETKWEYQPDPEGGERRNRIVEPDLRKGLDQFTMAYRKNQFYTGLEAKFRVSVAMIRSGLRETNLLRGKLIEGAQSGVDETATSRAEEDLGKFYRLLSLSQHTQQEMKAGSKRAAMLLGAMGQSMTLVALGLNLKTAAASFASNFFSTVGKGLANWGQKEGFTLPAMTKAFMALGTEYGKAQAVARMNRVLKMDEGDLLNDRLTNGEGVRGSDTISEAYIFDRMGDMALRLWLMMSQMMADGTWDVYDYDKKTGTLTYNEAKDREQRGDKVVNAVRSRLIQTGEMKEGEAMTKSHDDRMRRTLEAWTADVMLGYKDEVETVMATNVWLRHTKKLRGFMVKKLENWTKEKRYNDNKGQYREKDPMDEGYLDEDDAEWVSKEEVGLFRSMAKLLGGGITHGGNFIKAWKDEDGGMSDADRYNLKVLTANSAILALMCSLGWALLDDDEAEKKRRRAGQGKSLGRHVLDSVVNDMFLPNEIGGVSGIAGSPLVSYTYWTRMGNAVLRVLHGDVKGGTKTILQNTGAYKTYQVFHDMVQ